MTAQPSCPICGSISCTPYLQVKDYTVSQETFQIMECTQCRFLFTHPVPKDLGSYYQSVAYISHSNQTNNITDLLYKTARTFTLRWKTNTIQKYTQSQTKHLLDYGCGTGAFLSHAKKQGWTISGVEPAYQPRQIATQATTVAINKSIDDLTSQQFDAITLWHVLEHIPDLHNIIGQLATRLKNNGTIFIAVPNHNSFDANYYQSQWAAYDTPRHLWHFGKKDINTLLNAHQLKLTEILPMKLDAYYVSILSEKYKHETQTLGTLIRGMAMGLKSNLKASRTKEYSSLIYIARK